MLGRDVMLRPEKFKLLQKKTQKNLGELAQKKI